MKWVQQGLGFTAVGGLQLLLDWGVLVAFSAAGVPLIMANVAGRAAGASLGFWANRRVTFHGNDRPPLPQILRFVLLWAGLTLLSTLAMAWVVQHGSLAGAWLVKPLIEACLSVVSFLGCRHWVYR